MVLSVLVAMILRQRCAPRCKTGSQRRNHGQRGFFGWFNRTFNHNASRYEKPRSAKFFIARCAG